LTVGEIFIIMLIKKEGGMNFSINDYAKRFDKQSSILLRLF